MAGEGRPRPQGGRDALIGLGLLLALALVSVMLGLAVEALGGVVWG